MTLSSMNGFARALLTRDGAAGRRPDVHIQELFRGAHILTATWTSRAPTAAGLDLEAVIDQMREQVANAE